jgi:anti-anti-sigma factor
MEIKDIPGHEGVKLIEFSGELDPHTSEKLREELTVFIEKGNFYLIADLSRVKFCDSRGVLIFIDCHTLTLEHHGYFRICRPSADILGLLNLLGFTKMLFIYDTLEAALKG